MRAGNYRRIKGQPYTRKEFARGFPPPKITKFVMGDTKKKFAYQLRLVACKPAQIRHNALEAARVAVNRYLSQNLSKNYCFRILPYPHVILRENKMIFGAHADRLQEGMQRAFGKPIGTAARVRINQTIMIVNVDEDGVKVAREALRRGAAKLPIPCKTIISQVQQRKLF